MGRALAAALVLLPLMLAEAQSPGGPERLLERIAAEFISTASQSWKDYRVCEHRPKVDDKRAFLRKSFGKKLFPASARVDWKELQVREEGASSSLHLGLVAVTFQEQREAAAVHAQLSAAAQPYLKNTKILTQYKALLQESTVLIAYSETFSHEVLQRFMAGVSR